MVPGAVLEGIRSDFSDLRREVKQKVEGGTFCSGLATEQLSQCPRRLETVDLADTAVCSSKIESNDWKMSIFS